VPPLQSSDPPSSESSSADVARGENGANKRMLFRAFLSVAIGWLAASPVIWWTNLSERMDAPIPITSMIQPIALAVVGLMSLPFLWRQSLRALIALEASVLVILLSVFVYPTVVPDGVVVNAVLAFGLGLSAWLLFPRLSHAKRED